VTRIDPGVVTLVAQLRRNERQAAEELGRGRQHSADRKVILDQRVAGMAEIPGGGSGLLVRGCKGKEADRLVTRIGPSVVSRVELRGHTRQAAGGATIRRPNAHKC
jgi:hypothetical protein